MMWYVSVPSSHMGSILVSATFKPIRLMVSISFWHCGLSISSGVIPSHRGLILSLRKSFLVIPPSCVVSSLSTAFPNLVQLLPTIQLTDLYH